MTGDIQPMNGVGRYRGDPPNDAELDVIVVGGGQAGLAMGWHLAERGLSFLILDASAKTGDVWRSKT